MKTTVMKDVYDIVCPTGGLVWLESPVTEPLSGVPDVKDKGNVEQVGTFELLYDELASTDALERERKAKSTKKVGTWK